MKIHKGGARWYEMWNEAFEVKDPVKFGDLPHSLQEAWLSFAKMANAHVERFERDECSYEE